VTNVRFDRRLMRRVTDDPVCGEPPRGRDVSHDPVTGVARARLARGALVRSLIRIAADTGRGILWAHSDSGRTSFGVATRLSARGTPPSQMQRGPAGAPRPLSL